MSSTSTVKPDKGEKVYRMSNDQLVDADNNKLANCDGNVVNFKVQYPDKYEGVKYMKEGQTHSLHVLHAEALQEKGLGKIVKDK